MTRTHKPKRGTLATQPLKHCSRARTCKNRFLDSIITGRTAAKLNLPFGIPELKPDPGEITPEMTHKTRWYTICSFSASNFGPLFTYAYYQYSAFWAEARSSNGFFQRAPLDLCRGHREKVSAEFSCELVLESEGGFEGGLDVEPDLRFPTLALSRPAPSTRPTAHTGTT